MTMGEVHMIPPGVRRFLRHADALERKSRKAKLARAKAAYNRALLNGDTDGLLKAMDRMHEARDDRA